MWWFHAVSTLYTKYYRIRRWQKFQDRKPIGAVRGWTGKKMQCESTNGQKDGSLLGVMDGRATLLMDREVVGASSLLCVYLSTIYLFK